MKGYVVEDDVLRLDVSVYDPERVDFVDSLADLSHDEGDPGLGQRLSLFELMVKLSSSPDLQDDVDVECIVEAAVHLDDVRVIEVHLDLHLPYELIGDFLLMKQLLLDYLQGADEVGRPLPYKVHSPVLAVAQLFDLDEVVNAHLPGLGLREVPQRL